MGAFNEEAERCVLGCCYMDSGAHARARRHISAESFYKSEHRHVWRAMEDLRNRGEAIDRVSVVDHLNELGVLEAAGGANAVATLDNTVPSTVNVDTYINIVRSDFDRRRLRATLQRAGQSLEQEEPLEEVVRSVSDVVRSFRQHTSTRVAVEAYEWLETVLERKATGLSLEKTAPWFDRLAGPIQRGAYYVVGAMSGHGKTTLTGSILSAAKKADASVRCLWFSCEIPPRFQMFRLMASHYGVPERWFLEPHKVPVKHQDFFWEKATHMADVEKWCTIRMEPTLDARRIAIEIEAEVAQYPDAHVICVVDYVQQCEAGRPSRYENVARSSAILSGTALATDATVFALSQFTDSTARTHPIPLPTGGQLRSARELEHDAVQLLIYHRPWNDRRCMLAMPKSRFPLRQPGYVELVGDGQANAFKLQRGSCEGADVYLPRA